MVGVCLCAPRKLVLGLPTTRQKIRRARTVTRTSALTWAWTGALPLVTISACPLQIMYIMHTKRNPHSIDAQSPTTIV